MSKLYIRVILFSVFLISCGEKNEMLLVSENHSNISFNNEVIESDSLNILNYEYIYNGGGVAIADFNRDGKEDIYFTGNVVNNKLYLNEGDFVFKDVSSISQTECSGSWSMGVSVIDINNDNWPDMYVSVSGKGKPINRKNILLINQGINKDSIPVFKNMAKEYGLDYDGYTINSYFFDFDQDGDNDIYLINNFFTNRGDVLSKRNTSSNLINDNVNVLFENIDGKSFKDITIHAGVLNDGYSLSANIFDINDDGWLDIFVSNDFATSSSAYINQKDGTFEEDIVSYFKHQSFSSMGVDVADFDNNGSDDLITLDMLPRTLSRTKKMFSRSNFLFYDLLDLYKEKPQYMRNCLYVNDFNDYNEISQLSKVHNTDWSWSPIFADFDNDGKKDLHITNGFPRDLTDLDFINYRDSYESVLATTKDFLDLIPRVKISNVMFLNSGNYDFFDITKSWNMETPSYSYGQAIGDLDNDGDLDVVVNNLNDKAFLYKNELNSKPSYLTVKLIGSKDNLESLHSEIIIYYNDSLEQKGTMNPHRGYLSSLSPKIHFGIKGVKKVDSLILNWNSKEYSILKDLEINQEITVNYELEKKFLVSDLINLKKPLVTLSKDSILQFDHKENKSYDFFDYELQQRVYTNEGPSSVVGDINGDSHDDIIVGGATGQKGKIFFQNKNGFTSKELSIDAQGKELTALSLFDFDKDNDLDLYLGYGHNGSKDSTSLVDVLAINDGKGNFIKSNLLPNLYQVTSKALPFDFDNDGDIDLLVTSRVKPDSYPDSPRTYLLENKNGKFEDVSDQVLPDNGYLGMITDAEIIDINNDEKTDIILSGEWMGIEILVSKDDNKFILDKSFFPEKNNGFWNSIETNDLDGDGDLDLIVGNYGKNTPYNISKEKPLLMKYGDFNGNGRPEPLVFHYCEGDYFPIHLRNNFLNQIQKKKSDFINYELYSKAPMSEVLNKEEQKISKTLKVHNYNTTIYENNDEKFVEHILPVEVQFSPIFDTKVVDINNDGLKEIFFIGNDNAYEVFTGPRNSFQGSVVSFKKGFNFEIIPKKLSGFDVPFYGRSIETLRIKDKNALFVTQNNNKSLLFKSK
ncbi:MAG: hypothetical protein CMD29_02345 [Flavobacteriales bacterium]|nr:hypothetical protein [Flavobacteriales bacterium]